MRQLTHYGKRVMASVGLVIAIALVIVVGFLMVTDGGVLLHIDPQAFNVLAIMVVMPILCKVIVPPRPDRAPSTGCWYARTRPSA